MTFLAQFSHHPERLDLRGSGRALFVFHCNHDPGMCDDYDYEAGANAALVLDVARMTGHASALPSDQPPVNHEVRIVQWLERDDGLSPQLRSAFFKEATYSQLGEAIIDKTTDETRLAGVPLWIQSADEGPRDGWRFLGQLGWLHKFLRTPKASYPWVSPGRAGNAPFVGEGPNFGDAGLAYLFISETDDPPRAAIFWQCS